MIDSKEFSVFITYFYVDECYIGVCLEYPGISAYGDTRIEAAEEMETALDLLEEQLEEEEEDVNFERENEDYDEFLNRVFEKTKQ